MPFMPQGAVLLDALAEKAQTTARNITLGQPETKAQWGTCYVKRGDEEVCYIYGENPDRVGEIGFFARN